MARIVLAAQISGTRDGKVWPGIGSEVDLPDAEAADLVRTDAAVWPDDPRVEKLRAGYHGDDFDLAGAPTGRDATEGQPDTNLARARYLADKHQGDVASARTETRKAAKKVDYTDEQTANLGTGRVPGDPVVGDDAPAPARADADAVEAADAPVVGEERAVARSEPRKR